MHQWTLVQLQSASGWRIKNCEIWRYNWKTIFMHIYQEAVYMDKLGFSVFIYWKFLFLCCCLLICLFCNHTPTLSPTSCSHSILFFHVSTHFLFMTMNETSTSCSNKSFTYSKNSFSVFKLKNLTFLLAFVYLFFFFFEVIQRLASKCNSIPQNVCIVSVRTSFAW